MWSHVAQGVSFAANVVEIIVGCIAIGVAWTQRYKISAAFSILFSYSLLATLSDLNHWLEELHQCGTSDELQSKRLRIALARIFGTIQGNATLYQHLGDKVLKRLKTMIDELDNDNDFKQTSVIAIGSEIQQRLTSIQVENHTPKTIGK